ATRFGTRLCRSLWRSDTCDRTSETMDCTTSTRELACAAADRMSLRSEARFTRTADTMSEISDALTLAVIPAMADFTSDAKSLSCESVATRFGTRDWKSDCRSLNSE